MMMAVRAGEARQFTETRASEFTRSELKTLKTKVATCTHTWESNAADEQIWIKRTASRMADHAAQRTQHTLGTMGGGRVGGNIVGAVEHLVGKGDGGAGSC